VAAVAASAGTAALLVTRHRVFGGLTALAGALALLFADAWESTDQHSRERFAGRVLDRVYEASILVPLAWVSRTAAEGETALALVGLGASYLASYERAKGQALGYHVVEHPVFKRTRYAILVLSLLSGWLLVGLWVYVVLASAAAVIAAWNVERQDRRLSSADKAPR
jgi:hypothetical protein